MSEPEIGCALDVNTFTVFLVGKPLIKDIFENLTESLHAHSMETYNKVALAIVRIHGPAYGIDPQNIPEPERWSLGTVNKEDLDYMRSFLPVKELMRSEVVSYTNEKAITPDKE
jgi:hypothetical protein